VPQPLATGFLSRFWFGLAFGVLNGFVVFRWSVFRPDEDAFECLVAGALLAGAVSLVRLRRHSQALALGLVYGAFRLAFAPDGRLSAGLAGLLIGLGAFLVAVVYDDLARYGLRFGKFLIVGPLLGGAFLAVAPLSQLDQLTVYNAVHPLLYQGALGIVVGEGVGLGVELVELLSWFVERRARRTG
jgi:hypothetical protein